jgi:hypothetical protein
MSDLLDRSGKGIHERLKKFGGQSDRGTSFWKDRDFRVDPASISEPTGARTWNLQVNRNPTSQAAKNVLKKCERGSHGKVFEDTFDLKNKPDYDTWKQSTLKQLD